jgi:hypothetical protein
VYGCFLLLGGSFKKKGLLRGLTVLLLSICWGMMSMSLCCNECGVTLEFASINVFEPRYELSLMKRTQEGLWISNTGSALCTREYSRVAGALITDPDEIKEGIFFAMDEKDGFYGAASAGPIPPYRFLPRDLALQHLHKTAEGLIQSAESYQATLNRIGAKSGIDAKVQREIKRLSRLRKGGQLTSEQKSTLFRLEYWEAVGHFWLDYAAHAAERDPKHALRASDQTN